MSNQFTEGDRVVLTVPDPEAPPGSATIDVEGSVYEVVDDAIKVRGIPTHWPADHLGRLRENYYTGLASDARQA